LERQSAHIHEWANAIGKMLPRKIEETYLLLVGLVVILLPGFARPQGVDADFRVTSEPIEPVHVIMGRTTPVAFTFHIKPGFHVNSHQPTQPQLIPTDLRFSPPEDLVIAKKQYPEGVLTMFPFDPNNKLSVYSDYIIVKAVVLAAPKATAGNYTVHGELKYQACDNNSCYPPKILPIQFDVKLSGSAARGPRARPNAQSPHIHN
jgi:Disulphide bond corrector protein DsbC